MYCYCADKVLRYNHELSLGKEVFSVIKTPDFYTLTELDMSKMNDQELDEALDRGYQDVLAGRAKPAAEVFEAIQKEYGL